MFLSLRGLWGPKVLGLVRMRSIEFLGKFLGFYQVPKLRNLIFFVLGGSGASNLTELWPLENILIHSLTYRVIVVLTHAWNILGHQMQL